MLRPYGEIARTQGHRAVAFVLGGVVLGAAGMLAGACFPAADLGSPVVDAGAETGAVRMQDSGPPTGHDASADSAPVDAGSDAPPPGPPGSLDPSFGAGTGMVTLGAVAPAYLGPHSIAVLPNGAVAYGGEYMDNANGTFELLAGRVLSDGTVDKSFNMSGVLTYQQSGYWDEVGGAMWLLPGGGMQITGFIDPDTDPNHEMFTVRINASGQFDSTFGGGTGFLAVADNNVDSKANDVLLQPDGMILLAGFQGPQGAIARLAPDGTLDPTWGAPSDSGSIGAAQYPSLGNIIRLGQQSNGDILAAPGGSSFVVAALTHNGALDPTYGTNGVATVTIQAPLTAGTDMVVQADDSVVCVNSTATTIELLRLTPTGQLDPTFGEASGRTSVPSPLTASSLAMLADGSFVVAAVDTDNIVGILHFTKNGVLDMTFGKAGIVSMPVPVNNSASVAVGPSGLIVVGAGTDTGVVIARLFP